MGTVGIPVKLLHEAVGHVITVELKGGASYRGRLFDGASAARRERGTDGAQPRTTLTSR